MAIAMMVFAISASAQREPGTFTIQPKVGYNFSIISNDDKNVDMKGRSSYDFGGLNVELRINGGAVKTFSNKDYVNGSLMLSAGYKFALK